MEKQPQLSSKTKDPYLRIATISPLIGAALVFFGFFKLQLYYQYFGVNIVDFMAFSEILISFLDDINLIVAYLVGALVYSIVVPNIFLSAYTRVLNRARTRAADKQAVEKVSVRSIGVLLPLMVLILSYFLMFYFEKEWIFIFILVFLLQFYAIFIKKVFKTNPSLGFMLFLLLISSTVTMAIYDIFDAVKTPKQIELTTNSGLIKTSGNEQFIGKTEEYFFIYNKQNHKVKIIPASTVQMISI